MDRPSRSQPLLPPSNDILPPLNIQMPLRSTKSVSHHPLPSLPSPPPAPPTPSIPLHPPHPKYQKHKEKHPETYSQNITPPNPPIPTPIPPFSTTLLTPSKTPLIPIGLLTPLYAPGLAPSHAGAPIYRRGLGERVLVERFLSQERMEVGKPGAPIWQEGLLKNWTPGDRCVS
jgi:hypothetical protein